MANWSTLKAAVANIVKTNGNQEITGALLQSTLFNIISSIGENATFAGIATPTTNPGTPDGPKFYLAIQPGIYANFSNTTIPEKDNMRVLLWNGINLNWQNIDTNIPSNDKVASLIQGVLSLTNTIAMGQITLDGSSEDPYAVLDSYNTFKQKGFYQLSWDGSFPGCHLLVTGDDFGGHVIHQFIFGCLTIEDGKIKGHADFTPSIIVRTYNYRSAISNPEIPKGQWGPWKRYEDTFLPVTEDKIADKAVTTKKIADEAVTTEKIAAKAITKDKIADKAVTTDKIADSTVNTAKLVDASVTTQKLADKAVTADKIGISPAFLNFSASNIINTLDYEGFTANPSVWETSAGSAYNPIVSIEEHDNILGLKYTRCFTPVDKLTSSGTYYTKPYFTCRIPALKGAEAFSLSCFINIEHLVGFSSNILALGLDSNVSVLAKAGTWGTTKNIKAEQEYMGATISAECTIDYFTYKDKPWAFIKQKFILTNNDNIKDLQPSFSMQFRGFNPDIEYKIITCGWTVVVGNHDLLPFQYYPYNKNFLELFTSNKIADQDVTTENIADEAVTTEKIAAKAITKDKIADNININITPLSNGFYGQVGDSVSEGAGLSTLLSSTDPNLPVTGTKKATYGYYIAKLNNMRWANYGLSGTTLGDVIANGADKRGFSKINGRYTQMADDLTHISIFFGWNDAAYGHIMKREDWLYNTYNTLIYYPVSSNLIGTTAPNGIPYTTQSQYEAVNAVVGSVGGIEYNSSAAYFNALYVGTSTDNTNKTFWGAWNIVLPYLIKKYPLAKILLIVPYGASILIRQCVRDAAQKYGLPYYDFSSTNIQLFYNWDDNEPSGIIDGTSIAAFRRTSLFADSTHPNDNGYKYLYPSINAMLMSM